MKYLTAYILINVLALLIMLAAIKRRSNCIAILLLLFMWSICIFCTDAFDLRNMKYVYDNFPQVMEEYALGYDILFKTCIGLGLNFTAFKAIVSAFSLILTYMAIRKSTNYFALVIGLYAVYPFIGTVSQIRNGMMAAIVMYSLICFILDPRHSIWKYVVGIGLACMFHWSAVFYLILILAKRKINKKTFLVCLISLIIVIDIIIQKNLLYPILSQFISNTRVLQWFNFNEIIAWCTPEIYNWKSKLILVMCQIIGYVVFYMVFRNYKKCLRQPRYIASSAVISKNHYFDETTLDFINRIVLLLFCIVPFYILFPEFFRMYKNVLLLIYIVTAQYYFISKQSGYRVVTARRLCLGAFLYVLLLLSWTVVSVQGETIRMLNSFMLAG